MSFSLKAVFAGIAASIFTLFAHALAANATIEQSKADCVVGEQTNGYLGTVRGASTNVTIDREVRSVNQQRKTIYARLAEENGVTVEVIAQLTAERQINNAPSGHCVQNTDGSWTKRA